MATGVEQHGRAPRAALGVLDGAFVVALLALGEGDGELGRGVGLLLDRLVDGHALVAREDVLQALHGGVLAGDRDLAVEVLLASGRRWPRCRGRRWRQARRRSSGSLVSICSKMVPAWALSQSGTDWSGPFT